MKIRCLIVDDEPLALEVLETYLTKLTDIEIVAKCTNAIRASEILQSKDFDLMFLDIKMPQFDGISFLKTLQKPPSVILTTAYRDYALDGYDLNVIDYLLKPIPFDRFMKAINKYYKQKQINTGIDRTPASYTPLSNEFIYVKSDKKQVKIFLKDIYFLESMEDYVIVHKRDQKIITKDQMKRFEEILPQDLFLRIHRSYIISVNKVETITAETVKIGKRELPIGRSYKQSVQKALYKR